VTTSKLPKRAAGRRDPLDRELDDLGGLPELPRLGDAASMRVLVTAYSDLERRRQIDAARLDEQRQEVAHILRMQGARLTGATRRYTKLALLAGAGGSSNILSEVARDLGELALRSFTSAERLSPAPSDKPDFVDQAVDDLARACELLGCGDDGEGDQGSGLAVVPPPPTTPNGSPPRAA